MPPGSEHERRGPGHPRDPGDRIHLDRFRVALTPSPQGEGDATSPHRTREGHRRAGSVAIHRAESFARIILALDRGAIADKGVKHDGGVEQVLVRTCTPPHA